ncbi:hypothetical protein BKH44_00890 [Helicobacter sp. 13S00477-4]|nr:hypothetical protein BKH44_00890 [Helicobacter sp. 13S00477-4]
MFFLSFSAYQAIFAFEYHFTGDIANYSKFGFNHSIIDETIGQYPTDSFSILYSDPSFDFNFSNHFSAGIGFAFGGIIYDSTKFDKDIKGKLLNPDGLAYKYMGYYSGHDGKEKATPMDTKDYYFSNFFIGYDNDFFSFKIGRFLFKNTDWLTGNQEGIETHLKTKHIDTWGVITHKKSSLGGKWLKDFKYINSSTMPTFAIGSKITYPKITFIPYIQTQPNLYLMTGFHSTYQDSFTLWEIPIYSQTDIFGFYVHYTPSAKKRISTYDDGNTPVFGPINTPTLDGYKGRLVGQGGESFLLKQIFRIPQKNLKHHFGFQIYKNFGNANEFIGGYGNPLGLDLNDSTIYDRGTANNAIFATDAFNNIVFYGLKYQKLNINVVNRYTISPRSNEESLSLNMDYILKQKTSFGINLTYFDDTTKKGYQIYQTYLNHNIREDRSYLSTYIKHSF